MFTRTGRPRKKLTHAIQQVEDWFRFWREHPELVPDRLVPSVTPKGIVVIGTSAALSDLDKRRLAHLNSHRDV